MDQGFLSGLLLLWARPGARYRTRALCLLRHADDHRPRHGAHPAVRLCERHVPPHRRALARLFGDAERDDPRVGLDRRCVYRYVPGLLPARPDHDRRGAQAYPRKEEMACGCEPLHLPDLYDELHPAGGRGPLCQGGVGPYQA